MKKVNTDLKYLFFIWIILFLAIIPTYAHHGHLLIDCGREVYYPTQILSGEILYKDIFNIYGPFSYMFNAFLFKVFGISLNVLYIAGCVCAFCIASLIYTISKQFLSRFLSFAITIFTIAIGVLNLNLFNFIFPYSYAMLYGFVTFLASVWLLFKYQQNPEKIYSLYLSAFFAGVCITSKYEFLPYLLVILYAVLKIKPLKLKQYYFTILSLVFMPIFCFGILFLQGLEWKDLVLTALTIKRMAQSETLRYFYHMQGVYFNKRTFGVLILNFIKTIIPLGLLIWGFTVKKRSFSISLIIFALFLIIFSINPASFVFLPIFTFILALVSFKALKENPKLLILVLSCITIDLKVFLGLATLNYGVFFASFLLITVLAVITKRFENENINQNALGIYFLVVSVILGWQNLTSLNIKNNPIKSERGQIYSSKELASSTQDLINYINKNTRKTDTVVIFPEGPFINFLTNRKSDNYYNSLIPLYVETFGENTLIEHFKKKKPEYIIFNNWDTKDYYFEHICNDYAFSFCHFVAENYTQKKIIDKGFRYLIFQKR
ncbi:MAG: hypothetical protein WCG95_02040 [bacterium]